MSGWAWFILILIVVIIPLSIAGYIYYSRVKAQRAGLEPPPLSSYNPFARRERHTDIYPASSGILGWAKNKYHSLRNSASRTGAYEQPLGGGATGSRGLDPDEAWDTRVGAEADGYGAGGFYEEQELGLHPPAAGNTSYAGGGYGAQHNVPQYATEVPRGRSLSRDDGPYTQQHGDEDPFGDEAERSELRGVSPRPHAEVEPEGEAKAHTKKGSLEANDTSPTERRSMFHENV